MSGNTTYLCMLNPLTAKDESWKFDLGGLRPMLLCVTLCPLSQKSVKILALERLTFEPRYLRVPQHVLLCVKLPNNLPKQ